MIGGVKIDTQEVINIHQMTWIDPDAEDRVMDQVPTQNEQICNNVPSDPSRS